ANAWPPVFLMWAVRAPLRRLRVAAKRRGGIVRECQSRSMGVSEGRSASIADNGATVRSSVAAARPRRFVRAGAVDETFRPASIDCAAWSYGNKQVCAGRMDETGQWVTRARRSAELTQIRFPCLTARETRTLGGG